MILIDGRLALVVLNNLARDPAVLGSARIARIVVVARSGPAKVAFLDATDALGEIFGFGFELLAQSGHHLFVPGDVGLRWWRYGRGTPFVWNADGFVGILAARERDAHAAREREGRCCHVADQP